MFQRIHFSIASYVTARVECSNVSIRVIDVRKRNSPISSQTTRREEANDAVCLQAMFWSSPVDRDSTIEHLRSLHLLTSADTCRTNYPLKHDFNHALTCRLARPRLRITDDVCLVSQTCPITIDSATHIKS